MLELLCMRLLSARKSNDAYDQPSELHFIIADSGKNNDFGEAKPSPNLGEGTLSEKYPLRDSNPRPAD